MGHKYYPTNPTLSARKPKTEVRELQSLFRARKPSLCYSISVEIEDFKTQMVGNRCPA